MIEDQSTLRWELESVFPGGPGGDAFADFLSEGFRRAEALIARVDALPMLSEDPANLAAWATALLAAEALNTDTCEAYGFASAWACASTRRRR
jgi:hypothetical protein